MSGNGDYISREAANEACREAVRRYPNSFYNGIEAARDAIRKLPAADVRPAARGRDISSTVRGHCEFKCSVCEVELSSVYGGSNDFGMDGGRFNFCPNCGAMMDMREEHDD